MSGEENARVEEQRRNFRSTFATHASLPPRGWHWVYAAHWGIVNGIQTAISIIGSRISEVAQHTASMLVHQGNGRIGRASPGWREEPAAMNRNGSLWKTEPSPVHAAVSGPQEIQPSLRVAPGVSRGDETGRTARIKLPRPDFVSPERLSGEGHYRGLPLRWRAGEQPKLFHPMRTAVRGDVEGQFKAAPDADFVEGGAQVVLHNLFGGANDGSDFAVGHTLPDHGGDLDLFAG